MLAIVVWGYDMMTEEKERVPPSSGAERLETEAGPHVCHALVRLRMTSASEEGSPKFANDIDDDTIELALTEEDMLALSRAAEEEQAETSPDTSARVVTGAYLRDQSMRSRRWPQIIASSVLVIVISVALGVVAQRISMVTIPITAPSGAEQSAKSLDSPVRFSNPFDASEVFEFPPGTSDEQARQSVAAILLQRARDRQVAGAVKSNPPMPGARPARVARNSEPRRT
jgi:hypothetical protein